jgi:RNA polymerase sigma-70 factor (ECF subfamily)
VKTLARKPSPTAHAGRSRLKGDAAHSAEVIRFPSHHRRTVREEPERLGAEPDPDMNGATALANRVPGAAHWRDPGFDPEPAPLDDAEFDAPADEDVHDEADAAAAAGPATATDTGADISADDARLAGWIAAIVGHDERALAALYDATCHRVHGLALRIVQRQALAEEVVEDTFWQVWRQAARFDATRGRPLTWLLAMARSRAIDALRRDQRFRHEELPEDDLADAGSAAPPPQDLLDATRGQAALHAALLKIEPRSRQLVALAFFRGWTHEEIAEQQGLPLGTVKSLIRRALIALRHHLEAGDAR